MKTKSILLLIVIASIAKQSFGQSDTLFLDKDWKKCNRKEAKFYELAIKNGNNFIVKDFYINNVLQMVAECSSADPVVRNGECTTYDENGIHDSFGNYDHDKGVGVWTLWEDGGKDSTVFEFKPDGSMYYINKGHYDIIRRKKQFIVMEGKGTPTVIFVSGKGREQNDFTKVFKGIKKSTQIFAYDRAGLGQSESLNNERTVDTMAYELNELLIKEKIKSPFILVGHSMGGFIIRCFANMYPKKVAGLIFIDAACEVEFNKGLEIRTEPDKIKYREEFKSLLNVPTRTRGQNDESKYMLDLDDNGFSTNQKIVKDLKIPNNVPITVFISTKTNDNDPYSKRMIDIRLDYFENWKKQAAQTKIISTSKSGHYIQIEEPNLIIDGINEMLKQIRAKK